MHLIDRYIVREVCRPLLALLGVLTVIFASYTAARYLNEAASGVIGLGTVLKITGYRVLIALEVLAPVGLYVSVVIGLGRMHHDQEMVVIAAAGINPLRTYYAVSLLALPVAVAVGMLSMYGRPWAYTESYALEAQKTNDLDLTRLQAERFNTNADTGRMILAKRVDAADGKLRDVLIYSDGKKRNHLIRAREAWLSDPDPLHPVLQLRDGVSYSLHQSGTHDRTLRFRELTIELKPVQSAVEYRRKAAPTAELAVSSALPDRAELQWRLSRGPTALLLALLAVPLAHTPPRRGRFARLLPVTAVFAVIYYAGGMFKNLIEKGNLPMTPGLWLIPLVMAVALFLLMRRSAKP
ncbi:MAG TPA: LPS export ABC transporter permease LptF [Methyloversatilis sp.]